MKPSCLTSQIDELFPLSHGSCIQVSFCDFCQLVQVCSNLFFFSFGYFLIIRLKKLSIIYGGHFSAKSLHAVFQRHIKLAGC